MRNSVEKEKYDELEVAMGFFVADDAGVWDATGPKGPRECPCSDCTVLLGEYPSASIAQFPEAGRGLRVLTKQGEAAKISCTRLVLKILVANYRKMGL